MQCVVSVRLSVFHLYFICITLLITTNAAVPYEIKFRYILYHDLTVKMEKVQENCGFQIHRI